MAITGDPTVADLRESNALSLILRHAPSRGSFLTTKDQLDELVSQFDTVAEAGNVGGTLGFLLPHRCKETLPELCSSGPIHLWQRCSLRSRHFAQGNRRVLPNTERYARILIYELCTQKC